MTIDGDNDLSDFSEFDRIEEMSNEDAVAYLLLLARRCNTIADLARKEATRRLSALPDGEICETSNGTRMRMTSKTMRKVDVSALKEIYPDIYMRLVEKGEVSISPKSLDKGEAEGAIVITSSRFAELCR